MSLVRIQKLLASWGVASRRGIENFIKEGRITVNDTLLTEQGFLIDEDNLPVIALDGKRIIPNQIKDYTILLFMCMINKKALSSWANKSDAKLVKKT